MQEKGASKVEETEYGFKDFISYEILSEWSFLKETDDGLKVYYRTADVSKSTDDVVLKILVSDKVSVLESVTKPMVDGITEQPTLTFVAYAVQYSGFEPQDGETVPASALRAWEQAAGNKP